MKINYLIVCLLLLTLYSCFEKKIDPLQGKSWTGKIFRSSDDFELSEAKIKISNDTLFLFSNAIFGANNDTLKMSKTFITETDSVITFLNQKDGVNQTVQILFDELNPSLLKIMGTDFYIDLKLMNQDLFFGNELAFFGNEIVSSNANYYLNGIYEGKIFMKNSVYNLLYGPIAMKYKLKFIDNKKVEMRMSGGFLNTTSGKSIEDYKIVTNKLYIGKNPNKYLLISEDGRKLYGEDKEIEGTLYKTF